jgi:Zn-finger nucleic acid-binding protein
MKRRINPRLLKSEPLRRCRLEECRAACCLHGAWVDRVEIEDILAHANQIAVHMPAGFEDPGDWFDEREEKDEYALSGKVGHTRVLSDADHYGGTACIFMRADYKCALQVTADQLGFHPWRFKPFYCILHPLDLDEQGRITLDDTELFLSEPGSCLRSASEVTPLIEIFADELRYLLGEKGYRELKART